MKHDLAPDSLVLAARHAPSGVNHDFAGQGLSFLDYVAQTRAMLAKIKRPQLRMPLQEVIDGNAPFELRPAHHPGKTHCWRRGILLTHGLTDSPYFMRPLAHFLQQQGFYVMVLLLPGHGSQPGDLLKIRWQSWQQALHYGVSRLARQVDEVYLGGFSAGGLLSLLHSVDDPQVRALLLFAPALQINPLAALAGLHKVCSWCQPQQSWLNIAPDINPFKYESSPKNLASQMYQLTRVTKSRFSQSKLNIPMFVVASEQDHTVSTPAILDFVSLHSGCENRLLLYSANSATARMVLPASQQRVCQSYLPEQRILSGAHTAIMLPPDDPWYGQTGRYVNAVHYLPQQLESYQACWQQQDRVWRGEINKEALQQYTVQRLMYNPNFAVMLDELGLFLQQIDSAN